METNVENETNFKKICQYVGLPQNSVPRGNLLSITRYTISSIFRLLTVTHGQGLMSIKFNALFMCKQHPNSHGTTQYYIKLSCGKYQIDADVMQSIVIAINSFFVLIIINLVSIDYNYSWSHHSGNCTNCKHYRSNILMRLITITTWISLLVTISLPPSSLQLPTQMA